MEFVPSVASKRRDSDRHREELVAQAAAADERATEERAAVAGMKVKQVDANRAAMRSSTVLQDEPAKGEGTFLFYIIFAVCTLARDRTLISIPCTIHTLLCRSHLQGTW